MLFLDSNARSKRLVIQKSQDLSKTPLQTDQQYDNHFVPRKPPESGAKQGGGSDNEFEMNPSHPRTETLIDILARQFGNEAPRRRRATFGNSYRFAGQPGGNSFFYSYGGPNSYASGHSGNNYEYYDAQAGPGYHEYHQKPSSYHYEGGFADQGGYEYHSTGSGHFSVSSYKPNYYAGNFGYHGGNFPVGNIGSFHGPGGTFQEVSPGNYHLHIGSSGGSPAVEPSVFTIGKPSFPNRPSEDLDTLFGSDQKPNKPTKEPVPDTTDTSETQEQIGEILEDLFPDPPSDSSKNKANPLRRPYEYD